MATSVKFIAILLLAITVAKASGSDDASGDSNLQTVYNYLGRYSIITHAIDFGCNLKEFLKDQEVSDRLLKLNSDLPEVIKKGAECAKSLLLETANNKDSAIGKAINALRMGNSGEITRLSDIFAHLPRGPFIIPYLLMGGLATLARSIDIDNVHKELDDVVDQIVNKCEGKAIKEELEGAVKFLSDKFDEISTKNYKFD